MRRAHFDNLNSDRPNSPRVPNLDVLYSLEAQLDAKLRFQAAVETELSPPETHTSGNDLGFLKIEDRLGEAVQLLNDAH